MQKALQTLGYFNGTGYTAGYFDGHTVAALIRFQLQNVAEWDKLFFNDGSYGGTGSATTNKVNAVYTYMEQLACNGGNAYNNSIILQAKYGYKKSTDPRSQNPLDYVEFRNGKVYDKGNAAGLMTLEGAYR